MKIVTIIWNGVLDAKYICTLQNTKSIQTVIREKLKSLPITPVEPYTTKIGKLQSSTIASYYQIDANNYSNFFIAVAETKITVAETVRAKTKQ